MTILNSEYMKMKSKLLPVTKNRTEHIKYLKYLEFKIIISKQNIPSRLIQLNSFLYMGTIYKSSYYASEKKENSKTGNLLMISLSLRNLKQLKRRNI